MIKSIGLGIRRPAGLDGIMTIDTAVDYAYGRRTVDLFFGGESFWDHN